MSGPRHRYRTEDWVPLPLEQVFAFFAQPKNLPRLMPRWQRPRIDMLTLVPPFAANAPESALSGAAGKGSHVLLSFRPVPFCPFRLRWLALIDDFALNDRFCDYAIRSPFAYWRHCHRVQAESHKGQPGTRITDEVHYTLPLGLLDPLANAAFMHWQVRAIFAYRKRKLRQLMHLS